MGDAKSRSAQMGNLLTSRTLVLMMVCQALGIWYIVEQPASSLMQFHVLFQRFLKLVSLKRLAIKMADFGAETEKPTLLYSSGLELFNLRTVCSKFPHMLWYSVLFRVYVYVVMFVPGISCKVTVLLTSSHLLHAAVVSKKKKW